MTDVPPHPLDRPGFELAFHDEFAQGSLDAAKWLPYYLPQWSSRAQAAANHAFENGHLVLRIDEQQPPWCPEYDGDIRVSSLQTGVYSGPVGSTHGQHRFNRHSVVREEQPARWTFTPLYGFFEMRARAEIEPGNHVALWMIGLEDEPARSAEICICEIFGKHATAASCRVGFGLHPFGDTRIRDDFREVELPMDVRDFHVYAADWSPTQVAFFVDGRHVGTVPQSPDYPMQFMLGIYERPQELPRALDGRPRATVYPRRFIVDYVRAYRRLAVSS